MKTFSHIAVAATALALNCTPTLAQESGVDLTSPPAQITSKGSQRAQNHQAEKAVRKALTSTKGLNSENIVVLARNGKITLDGSVREQSQIELAGDAASKVSQSKSVTNNLTVREPGN